jgi:nucleoside-diphosphate-sugar epimerase
MQTILGAGGSIGHFLEPFLKNYTGRVRLVSRNPKLINPGSELFIADLLVEEQVSAAVKGSDVVYLTAGLKYDLKTWQASWPLIMDNVIRACLKHGAKLVFFDNVYMYGNVTGWMTEETPYNPCSRKGEIRALIATRLMDETSKGNIQVLIARSADFYGPMAYNTFLHSMVFGKLKNRKSASWLANDGVRHSFTFIPDAARATAILGNTPDAFNRIWHLPTDHNPLTGKKFINKVARDLCITSKYSVLKPWMMKTAGLFNSLARESVEMNYQYEHEYLFDSSKFEKRFFKATSYDEGILETSKAYRS